MGSQQKEHLPYLDGWRGVAIAMVLLAHFFSVPWFDAGRFGVDLFFVLSGVLMARILFEQRTPIGKFYRRRISRIIPALWIFFALVIPLSIWTGHRISEHELVGLVTFTRTYMQPPIWNMTVPVSNTWSLNVEEHCYLLLSLVALLAFRSRLVIATLAALTLVSMAVHRHFDHSPDMPWLLTTECAATGLLASAAIRLYCVRVPFWAPLLLALPCYLSQAHWTLQAIVAPVLLALAVNNVGAAPWAVRPLSWRPLCWLGLISYSVYLWQQPFYRAHLPYHVGLVLAIAVGASSFYFLESPVRLWLNENWMPARRRKGSEYEDLGSGSGGGVAGGMRDAGAEEAGRAVSGVHERGAVHGDVGGRPDVRPGARRLSDADVLD